MGSIVKLSYLLMLIVLDGSYSTLTFDLKGRKRTLSQISCSELPRRLFAPSRLLHIDLQMEATNHLNGKVRIHWES